jgi:hypothetical protein
MKSIPSSTRTGAIAALLGAVLAVSLTPATADAASASAALPASLSQCNGTGFSCAWMYGNFESLNNSIQFFPPVQPGSCRNVGLPANSGALSFWNRTSITQRLWSGRNCTGPLGNYLVAPNRQIALSPFIIYSVGGV